MTRHNNAVTAVMASLFLLLVPTLAGAQETGPVSPLGSGYLLQVIGSLGLVVAIIIVGAWILRRTGHLTSTGAGNIVIYESVSLGAREKLLLVQVGEEQLLLGVCPGRIQALHALDRPIALAVQDPDSDTTMTFAKRMAAVLAKRNLP
ncbi:MAG: flagellar biosynthetic protein FliO [Gammaproteobacteria bacterium]|nr:MAG: flagellar biosynthetic protein FliO [Gammaproteobacteria bacterium]